MKLEPLRNVTSYLLLFALILALPILLSFVLSISGYRFSYVGASSQLINDHIVGWILVIGTLSIVASGIVSYALLHRRVTSNQASNRHLFIKYRLDILFVGAVFVLSYVGLLKSFPGTFLIADYRGATNVWLGVGGWSVLCLFCLEFILTALLDMRRYPYFRFLAVFIIFIPVLLSGSRIDFLSCLVAELAAYLFVTSGNIRNKVKFLSVIVLTVLVVAILVGNLRYSYGKHGLGALDMFAKQQQGLVEAKKSGMIYLSTIGDIGASVYQAVEVREHMQRDSKPGLLDMISNYSKRMPPGFMIQNRPHDIYFDMGFIFGGGALHAFGEGYFNAGMLGVVCVGLIFGLFVSISFLFRELFVVTNEPLYWVVFIAPWLLVIRGGWYQFFAIFKGIEILLALFGVLLVMRMLARGSVPVNPRGYVAKT